MSDQPRPLSERIADHAAMADDLGRLNRAGRRGGTIMSDLWVRKRSQAQCQAEMVWHRAQYKARLGIAFRPACGNDLLRGRPWRKCYRYDSPWHNLESVQVSVDLPHGRLCQQCAREHRRRTATSAPGLAWLAGPPLGVIAALLRDRQRLAERLGEVEAQYRTHLEQDRRQTQAGCELKRLRAYEERTARSALQAAEARADRHAESIGRLLELPPSLTRDKLLALHSQ